MKKKRAKKKATRRSPRRRADASSTTTVDRKRLAAIFAVTTRTISTWEAEKIVTPLRRGRGGRPSEYRLEDVVPQVIQFLTGGPQTGSDREARRRRDDAQARLTELRIARETSELIPRDEVALAGQNYTKAWAAKVRQLPRRLVQAGLIPPASENRVREFLHDVLREIAGWKNTEAVERFLEESEVTR